MLERFCWLWLPLLFLPNLGVVLRTPYGVLELSDYLLWPLLGAAFFLAARRGGRRRLSGQAGRPVKMAKVFLAWSFLGSMTAGLRFELSTPGVVSFSMLKLAKFTAYGATGFLLATAIRTRRSTVRMLWALTVGSMITGGALIATAASQEVLKARAPVEGYKATNATSAQMGILLLFLLTAWVEGWGSRSWRKTAPYALSLAILGFLFSRGRGGWLAALVGLVYLLGRRKGVRLRALVAVALVLSVGVGAYLKVPIFREQVDKTLRPDPDYLEQYHAGFLGIDFGARLWAWRVEGRKIISAPLLGRGFFNRFPGSGLWWVGSHNFWLQMVLETGVVGGTICLSFLWMVWRLARKRMVLPSEVAVVVAFAAGMSGEYFYGGMPLLTLLLALGPALANAQSGGQPTQSRAVALIRPARPSSSPYRGPLRPTNEETPDA